MEAVREITVWTGVDYQQPNHDYLLDGDRVVAYRPWGTAEIRVLKGTLKIDRRGRKFERLEDNPFKDIGEKKEPLVLEVPGSKGNTYFVNVEEKSCTCPGFQFRGNCKHVEAL
jgi:hypothetical protein